MDRLRLGLVVLALAPLAWITGLLVGGSADYFLELGLLLLGLGFAAWALPSDRRWAAAAGFSLAAVAILWFYRGDLASGQANLAGGLFVLGSLAAAVGAALDSRRVVAVGLFGVALGGAFWVYVDGVNGGWTWEPGNVLATAGAALAGTMAWRGG